MRSRRLIAVTVSLFTAGIGSIAAPTHAFSAELHTKRFQMPSGNIYCHLQSKTSGGHGGFLRCDIRSGMDPTPKQNCELDWVGMLLDRTERARPNCASDTAWSKGMPVLAYGTSWSRRGRTCTARRSGLYCRNSAGYHFKLSREEWRRWHSD